MSATASRELDGIPDESTIRSLREEAEKEQSSIEVAFSSADGEAKRLVVSPRGTVVLLNEQVSEDTFNRSRSAADIAEDLQA